MYKRMPSTFSSIDCFSSLPYSIVPNKTFRLLGLLALIFALQACASLKQMGESMGVTSAPSTVEDKPAIEYRDFDLDKDTLYDLLVAEIAAQRGQLNVTLVNYIQQARVTRDVDIIKRAINAAQYSKDLEAIKEMGLLWLEVEPDNTSAHQLMAFQYSLQKQYADAMYHIERLLELGAEARVESLAVGSQQVSHNEKLELLKLYTALQERHPNNTDVAYALALVERNLKMLDSALTRLNDVIKRAPKMQSAVVLKADILYDQGKKQEALNFAEKKYNQFPENHALGRFYASLLIEHQRLDDAEEVFEELMERYPQAPAFKLSHALVMIENQKVDEASVELKELIEQGVHLNESHFYLARIADQKGDSDTAIKHYAEVKEGAHYESALERYTYLLTQAERTDEAIAHLAELREKTPSRALKLWILQYKLLSTIKEEELAEQTLNEALEIFPDDDQLRYARAMTYESRDDLEAMEADLRHIIEHNPKHAIAINALGYTLADRTDRLQEALQLISAALTLKPENPAIIDSMGWVLYRIGKLEEAALFLSQAYKRLQEAEIGAHLGEVLWELGDEKDAKIVWRDMLRRNPEHKVLLRTIERYHPALIEEVNAELAEGRFDPEQQPVNVPSIEIKRNSTAEQTEQTEEPEAQAAE
ncbi:MAG: tetratricopeptide repeat protein [Oleiphilaceae bacterium]|nr:tetratricopeptide repeat protein [Oleiphilaceae bacterium]